MEGLEVSLVMAQAALCVKNSSIDTLREELQGLRRENNDLFKAVLQRSSACGAAAAAAPAATTDPPVASATTTSAQHAETSTAGQHAEATQSDALQQQEAQQAAPDSENLALRQQLTQAQEQQEASHAEVESLRAELAAARQHIRSLEAELQDTMDAAMQLWDTIQVGDFDGAASSSRPGSLYQEQLSPLSGLYAEGDEDGRQWRTPSASPAPGPTPHSADVTPRGLADTAAGRASSAFQSPSLRSADAVTPTRDITLAAALAAGRALSPQLLLQQGAVLPVGISSSGSSVGGGAAAAGGAEGHVGLFTPIEARVQSLASKLRVYMMRQPGVPTAAASTLGTSVSTAGALLSPHRLQDSPAAAASAKVSYGGSPAAARIGAGVDASTAAGRDISSSDQQTAAV